MVSDPFTKAMKPDRLIATLETGVLDLRPTDESLAIKARNRELRKQARKTDHDERDPGTGPFETEQTDD